MRRNMTTYHRLLLLTALGSALLTFIMFQFAAVNAVTTEQKTPQQLQTLPLPQATEFYAMNQPRMMTLVWQPCDANNCEANPGNKSSDQQFEVSI